MKHFQFQLHMSMSKKIFYLLWSYPLLFVVLIFCSYSSWKGKQWTRQCYMYTFGEERLVEACNNYAHQYQYQVYYRHHHSPLIIVVCVIEITFIKQLRWLHIGVVFFEEDHAIIFRQAQFRLFNQFLVVNKIWRWQ